MEDPHIGIDKVEKILDACHTIKYQVPRTQGLKEETIKILKNIIQILVE